MTDYMTDHCSCHTGNAETVLGVFTVLFIYMHVCVCMCAYIYI